MILQEFFLYIFSVNIFLTNHIRFSRFIIFAKSFLIFFVNMKYYMDHLMFFVCFFFLEFLIVWQTFLLEIKNLDIFCLIISL